MDALTPPAEPSASAPPLPIRPTPIPTPPQSPPDDPRTRTLSTGSMTSQSRQEYLASLHVPSGEEIATISDVQRARAAELKRRSRELAQHTTSADGASESRPSCSNSKSLFRRTGSSPTGDRKRDEAAKLLQRTYRGYRTRREMAGLGLDASTRWTSAVREAQFRDLTTPRARETETERPGTGGRTVSGARQKWMKAATIARRGANDADEAAEETGSSSSSSDDGGDGGGRGGDVRNPERKRNEEAKARRKKDAKMMGLQYFLEMIDLKHRCGSNLRTYHEEWKRADTRENFFYWLDQGEGRGVDMDACPQERLDRERVRYLSREERQKGE